MKILPVLSSNNTAVGVFIPKERPTLANRRRAVENEGISMGGGTRAMREPRVVVQTTSDIDTLDDGYRWRKYR
uniref:WRKY transcription factor 7 n=1 Tax=Tanacetum cinerariifolium TaxID=118510 RepID=A0A6L2LRP4_TANCI|nr:WRKY transcription factor 7 [Tanacetum cinerariifolium]